MSDDLRLKALETAVHDLQDRLARYEGRGLDLLAFDRLTSLRSISPAGTAYWLTRQAGGNAQWITTRPLAADWSEV